MDQNRRQLASNHEGSLLSPIHLVHIQPLDAQEASYVPYHANITINLHLEYSFRVDHSDHCYTPALLSLVLDTKRMNNMQFSRFAVHCLQFCHLCVYLSYLIISLTCNVCSRIDGGELFDRVIGDDFILTEKSCTVFVRQICEGIAFIHSKNVLHLDLKVK